MGGILVPVAAQAQLLEHFPVVLDFILLPKDLPGKQASLVGIIIYQKLFSESNQCCGYRIRWICRKIIGLLYPSVSFLFMKALKKIRNKLQILLLE
jgi:hypothetical protein